MTKVVDNIVIQSKNLASSKNSFCGVKIRLQISNLWLPIVTK